MIYRVTVGVKAQCLVFLRYHTSTIHTIDGDRKQSYIRWLVFELIWETGKAGQWKFFVWKARY